MVPICSVILLSVGCWPYHGVMIITAYVGVDQWLLMVTFLPYPDRRLEPLPSLLLEQKYYAKHGTGQGFLSGRSSHKSVEETPIFSQFSSPAISSSRATIESPSLSKFSGQKINVFPITRGPAWLSSVLTTILVNTKACPHHSDYNNTQHSSQQISSSF